MKLLGGKPLVQWTIEAAKASGLFDPERIVVSSDWDAVLDFAKSMGVNPVRRPDSLSTGSARIEEIIDHTLHVLNLRSDESYPTSITLLNPTSPFRNVADIRQCFENTMASPKFTGGMSLKESNLIPMRNLSVGCRGERGYWRPVKIESDKRQDRKPMIVQNGAIYIVKGSFYKETNKWIGVKNAGYLMPQERSMDIDTVWDFLAAEAYAVEIGKRGGV